MRWDDVNARARGLATHLLDRDAMAALTAAPDWPAFLGRVASLGYPLDLGAGALVDPPAFDRAVSLVAAARLNLLGRWLAARSAALAVVLEDEERRTVRALLRGVAQGASPGARLRAVLPTPALPIRALERLTRAATVAELVRELLRLGHPAGRALEDLLRRTPSPALRSLEWTLARLFSERAIRAARAGGPVVRRYAAELVDQENAWTLLLAAPPESEPVTDQEFLPGGARLTREEFVRLRGERDSERLMEGLRAVMVGTALGAVLAQEPMDMVSLEPRATAARIAALRGEARRDPLGPAVVLGVLERIRAEARALRAIGWGVAFGAPPPAIASLMPEAA
jgi:vacuolar-type H+-ATPase subunit C/Vma6